MTEEVSLRPMALRPGGGVGPAANPFSTFGMGAGATLRSKVRWIVDGAQGMLELGAGRGPQG